MASINSSTLGIRQIQSALRRGAKDALVASGIEPSTRRGNKELILAVQRLALQPYSSLAEATQTGQALGQKIAELSQAKGKTDLDGGIIRQLMLTGEIPTVVKAIVKPAKTTPVVVSTAPKTAAPATPAAAEAKVEAAVDLGANEPVELDAVEEEIAMETPSEAIADLETEELDVEAVADEADLVTLVTDEADLVTDEADLVTDEADLVADEADLVTDEADLVTDEADLVTDEAGLVADDVITAETIETLEPEASAAPEPEPADASDVKSGEIVEAIDSSNLAEADEGLPSGAKAEILAAPADADEVVEPEAIGAGK